MAIKAVARSRERGGRAIEAPALQGGRAIASRALARRRSMRASPWLFSWQGESGVQSLDLDGVGSIPAIPPTQITCFLMRLNQLA